MTEAPRPSLMRSDTPDYMAPMWASCMDWAIRQPEMVEAFRKETGNNWQPGKTAIEQMVDKASGGDRAFCEGFIKWANENVWGKLDGEIPDDMGGPSKVTAQ